MLIFFDTEFSGLSSDPRLLSIGMVADSGQELYIEFTNGWSESDCSYWVMNNIVPLLGNGERLTRRDAVERIIAWLSSFEIQPTLLGETTWDTILLGELMKEFSVIADRFRIDVLEFSGKDQANSFDAKKGFDHHTGHATVAALLTTPTMWRKHVQPSGRTTLHPGRRRGSPATSALCALVRLRRTGMRRFPVSGGMMIKTPEQEVRQFLGAPRIFL